MLASIIAATGGISAVPLGVELPHKKSLILTELY